MITSSPISDSDVKGSHEYMSPEAWRYQVRGARSPVLLGYIKDSTDYCVMHWSTVGSTVDLTSICSIGQGGGADTLSEVDSRSDLWAVGVCMYKLTSGRAPFCVPTGTSSKHIVGEVLYKDYPAKCLCECIRQQQEALLASTATGVVVVQQPCWQVSTQFRDVVARCAYSAPEYVQTAFGHSILCCALTHSPALSHSRRALEKDLGAVKRRWSSASEMKAALEEVSTASACILMKVRTMQWAIPNMPMLLYRRLRWHLAGASTT
jgi:serine/threonine protein kinase